MRNSLIESVVASKGYKFIQDYNRRLYTLTVLEKELADTETLHHRKTAEGKGEVWENVKIKLYEFCKHSWSTEMYEKGASLEDLQKYHGHSKPETSLLYTKIDVLKRFKKFAEVIPIKREEKESGGNQ